jgi:starch-binding outer membrane protein, SusD/RagB family
MKRIFICFLSLIMLFSSCEDFLKQEPVDIITTGTVIEDGASALAALFGIYSRLQTAGLYGNRMIGVTGAASDELTHSGSFPSIRDFDNNQLTADNAEIRQLWPALFTGIYQANVLISTLESSKVLPRLTAAQRKQYVAEARALRAFLHLEGVKLFGDFPLATTVELSQLSSISRSSKSAVFAFIISELETASTELKAVENSKAAGPFRLTEWGVKGLLARAQLYNGNVSIAGQIANDVITNGGYSLSANYADAFKTGSSEAIFTVFFSASDQNGLPFQFLPAGRFEYAVSPQLLTAFGSTDKRAMITLNTGDPLARFAVNKYPDLSTGASLVPIVRLAEMYLIRAEANLGTSQSLSDLNLLRTRAGVPSNTNPTTLDAVLAERFVELSFEGHRWNDLIRTDKIDAVMNAINPTTWNPIVDKLFPIPFYDLNINKNLTQNTGY